MSTEGTANDLHVWVASSNAQRVANVSNVATLDSGVPWDTDRLQSAGSHCVPVGAADLRSLARSDGDDVNICVHMHHVKPTKQVKQDLHTSAAAASRTDSRSTFAQYVAEIQVLDAHVRNLRADMESLCHLWLACFRLCKS